MKTLTTSILGILMTLSSLAQAEHWREWKVCNGGDMVIDSMSGFGSKGPWTSYQAVIRDWGVVDHLLKEAPALYRFHNEKHELVIPLRIDLVLDHIEENGLHVYRREFYFHFVPTVSEDINYLIRVPAEGPGYRVEIFRGPRSSVGPDFEMGPEAFWLGDWFFETCYPV